MLQRTSVVRVFAYHRLQGVLVLRVLITERLVAGSQMDG